MAQAGWFNENAQRSYPFLSGTTGQLASAGALSVQRMPRELVVDAQIIVGVNIDYNAQTDRIWLHSVSRSSDTLTLRLRNSALDPEETDIALLDVTVSPSAEIQTVHVVWPFIRYDLECTTDRSWEVFITFGAFDATSLDAWIGDGDLLVDDAEATQFEPGVVRTLYQAYTRSLNLANSRRTHARADEGCEPIAWPETADNPEEWPVDGLGQAPTTVAADCIDGRVRFVEGFNCGIEVNASSNTLLISARPGAGEGVTGCVDVLVYPEEEPPPGRTTLDGGFRCEEVFRSINGVGGPNVPITAGSGVTVSSTPAEHKLVVAIDGNSLATCYPTVDPPADSVCAEIAATTTSANSNCSGRQAWLWLDADRTWHAQPDYPGYNEPCAGDCEDCEAPPPAWTPSPGSDGILEVTNCRCTSGCDSTNAPFWYWDPGLRTWYKLAGSGECPAGCVASAPETLVTNPLLPAVVRGICVQA